jgi:hypothetical protein
VRYIRGFFAFWYDFIVGDDWRVAAVVVVAFAITALGAHNGLTMWWFLPLVVGAGLTASTMQAVAKARKRP